MEEKGKKPCRVSWRVGQTWLTGSATCGEALEKVRNVWGEAQSIKKSRFKKRRKHSLFFE